MNATPKNRAGLYFFIVLLVLLLGVYFWKVLAVRAIQRSMEAERAEHVVQLREVLTGQAAQMLKLTGLPLGWAVRAAALKGDYDQINDFLSRFVKEPFVALVVFVDADGTIRAATDKKMEEEPGASFYDAAVLGSEQIDVVDSGEGDILIVVPVMGYDHRLGTVIVTYKRQAIDSQMPQSIRPEPAAS